MTELKKHVIAIYPGTFDPLTNGHIDLINRAKDLFDHIVVAIAKSDRKNPLFSLDERVALAKQSLAGIDKVSVEGFSGLLADFAEQKQATVLLRGVRTVADFEYESQLAEVNRSLNVGLESVLLTPRGELAHISSTIVRDVAAHGGDASKFVHPSVAQALNLKFPSKL